MDSNRLEPGGCSNKAGVETGHGKDRANVEREEAVAGHAAQGKRTQVENAQAAGLSQATRGSYYDKQGDGIDEKNENENDIIDYLVIIEIGHMHDNDSGMRS